MFSRYTRFIGLHLKSAAAVERQRDLWLGLLNGYEDFLLVLDQAQQVQRCEVSYTSLKIKRGNKGPEYSCCISLHMPQHSKWSSLLYSAHAIFYQGKLIFVHALLLAV